ncbi:MAG: hypothetical protein QOI68_4629, partial [Pseudonocardiales bacterium]|nr:hypothetical protein [Pseudonocardiales bacterium]
MTRRHPQRHGGGRVPFGGSSVGPSRCCPDIGDRGDRGDWGVGNSDGVGERGVGELA